MLRSTYLALIAVAVLACGKGDDKAKPAKADDQGKPPAASKTPVKPAPAPPATAETEGQIRVTINDEEKLFSHLDAKSNFVLANTFTLVGTTEASGGEELRIMGSGLSIPADGPFPFTVETEAPEEYMKRHKAHLAGKGPRTLQKMLNIMYTDASGARYVNASDAKLVVTSYEDGKVVGTLSATKLTPKKGDPLELGGGSIEVVTMTPAAGRTVEKAVTGQ